MDLAQGQCLWPTGRVSLKDRVGSGWPNPTCLFLFPNFTAASPFSPSLTFTPSPSRLSLSFLSYPPKFPRTTMAKLGSSPAPLITTTSGGGFRLGKAKPCLSPPRLLSSLSFPHSALNGEFGVVVLWVNPCGYRSWIFGWTRVGLVLCENHMCVGDV